MLAGYSLKAMLENLDPSVSSGEGSLLLIYGGTAPANADAAATGILLCTVSLDDTGTGITFEAAATSTTPYTTSVLEKNAGENWEGSVTTAGLATHYRHVVKGDSGNQSYLEPRIQGTIASLGADLDLPDPNLILSAVQRIDFYRIALPA